jgi:hypothetical protein
MPIFEGQQSKKEFMDRPFENGTYTLSGIFGMGIPFFVA